jgi:hypothetical protein
MMITSSGLWLRLSGMLETGVSTEIGNN